MVDSLKKNIALAPYTTYQIGGPADYFYIAKTKLDLINILKWVDDKDLAITMIGGGSNILVSDSGVRGLVVLNKVSNYHFEGETLIAESGTILSKLARETIEKEFSGLDFGANIPGTIGGAIVGNAGAYGEMLSNSLMSVTCWDTNKGIVEYKKNDFNFQYRASKLKNNSTIFVIEAIFRLEKGNKIEMLDRLRQDTSKRKRDFWGLNCGCFFKNPKNVEIKLNNKIVQNPTAGQLIDSLGLKNYSVNGVKVSDNHANVILNTGKAKAADILELEKIIIEKVKENYDIELKTEVIKVGEF